MTSAACCSGWEHPGTPTGSTGDLYGLPTYIAEPPNGAAPKGIVVIVPDAFGWEFVNLRLIADVFAERLGVRCLLPEFMDGKAMSLSGLLGLKDFGNKNNSWVTRLVGCVKAMVVFLPFLYRTRRSVCWPRIEPFFKGLREGTKLPVGVIGYCWGGYYAVKLAQGTSKTADGRPLIDAAFTAHPSLLSIPSDIEKIELPVSISLGTEDMVVSQAEAKKIEEIFAQKQQAAVEASGESRQKFEINLVEGALHGFAVRGDPSDKKELEYGQVAEDQTVGWFKQWLFGEK